jgi:hypothetical protein
MLSTPADSAAHPMQFAASYQKSGPGTARAPSGNLRGRKPGSALPTIYRIISTEPGVITCGVPSRSLHEPRLAVRGRHRAGLAAPDCGRIEQRRRLLHEPGNADGAAAGASQSEAFRGGELLLRLDQQLPMPFPEFVDYAARRNNARAVRRERPQPRVGGRRPETLRSPAPRVARLVKKSVSSQHENPAVGAAPLPGCPPNCYVFVGLLCARRQRTCDCRAANPCDELPPSHLSCSRYGQPMAAGLQGKGLRAFALKRMSPDLLCSARGRLRRLPHRRLECRRVRHPSRRRDAGLSRSAAIRDAGNDTPKSVPASTPPSLIAVKKG